MVFDWLNAFVGSGQVASEEGIQEAPVDLETAQLVNEFARLDIEIKEIEKKKKDLRQKILDRNPKAAKIGVAGGGAVSVSFVKTFDLKDPGLKERLLKAGVLEQVLEIKISTDKLHAVIELDPKIDRLVNKTETPKVEFRPAKR